MGSSSERSSAPESQLLSRRTLVRAGATAAWTVPLVQVVGAAPALAITQSPTFEVSITAAYQNQGDQIHVTGSVKNPGASAVGPVSLNFTLPASSTRTTVNGGDFTGSGTTLALTTLGAGSTGTFDVTFDVTSSPEGNVTAVASAPNANTNSNYYHLYATPQSAGLVWTSAINGVYLASDPSKFDVTTAIRNPGEYRAKNVQIKVTLPVSATTAPASPSGWGVTGSGLVWTFARTSDLPSSTSDGFTVRFAVGSAPDGSITGEAFASNITTSVSSTSNVTGKSIPTVGQVSGNYHSTDTTKLDVNATIGNSEAGTTTGLKVVVTLPVPGSAPSVSGWSTTGTGSSTTWTFTKDTQLAGNTGAPFAATFTVANGAGGSVSVSATATNSTATPSGSKLVDQATAVLRITKLTTSSPSNRKTVTVVAAIQNVAVPGSKTASSINLQVTMLRSTHPIASVTPTADWSNNGGSGKIYNFSYSKPLAPGDSTISDLSALINYGDNSEAASFVITGDVTGTNAVAEGQKTNPGQPG